MIRVMCAILQQHCLSALLTIAKRGWNHQHFLMMMNDLGSLQIHDVVSLVVVTLVAEGVKDVSDLDLVVDLDVVLQPEVLDLVVDHVVGFHLVKMVRVVEQV
jgi:hypothetical protein